MNRVGAALLVAIITVSSEREYAYCSGRWFINNRRASWNLARSRCNVGPKYLDPCTRNPCTLCITERERGVGEGVVEIENESARILLRFPRSPITTRYYLTSLSLYIYIASEQLRETLSFLAYIFLPRLGEGKHFSLLISKKKGKNGWRV